MSLSVGFKSVVKEIHSDTRNLELVITPIEKNLGSALGNTLRRLLFGFTPGSAITCVQIKNVHHEFSSISGMQEDLIDVLMNIQSLSIRMTDHGPSFIEIHKKGPLAITGADVICPPNVEVVNKDQYICTLNETGQFDIRMTVEAGMGYLSSSSHAPRKYTGNGIFLDVAFCPVTHVCYHVKHFTFYEELVLHLQTNGSVSPREAIEHSLSILRGKF